MTHKKPTRRRQLSRNAVLWTVACLQWCEHDSIASESPRRRLKQMLRRSIYTNESSTPSNAAATRASLLEATAVLPLHATAGTHHVHVYIGSPPQRQTLIVDTGSRLMAFPCRPCHVCSRHTSNYYDPSLSTTDVVSTCEACFLNDISKCSEFNNRCILTQRYTEGSSWTAFEVEDLVWFGTSNFHESIQDLMRLAVPYTFGCQTSEKGLFRAQYADGILGLALHQTSLIRTLHAAGSIPRHAFSLCFTKTGGYISLGGTFPSEHHLEPMKFSRLGREDGFFSLTVVEVRLGHICVTCDDDPSHPSPILMAFAEGKGTILDSGTTDTYFPKTVAEPMKQAWSDLLGFPFSQRTRVYSYRQFQNLPDVAISFVGNMTLTMKPENYMEGVPVDAQGIPTHWQGEKELSNRIYVDEPVGAVLGANAMIGYDVFYDVEDHRVGMARSNCFVDVGTPTIMTT